MTDSGANTLRFEPATNTRETSTLPLCFPAIRNGRRFLVTLRTILKKYFHEQSNYFEFDNLLLACENMYQVIMKSISIRTPPYQNNIQFTFVPKQVKNL